MSPDSTSAAGVSPDGVRQIKDGGQRARAGAEVSDGKVDAVLTHAKALRIHAHDLDAAGVGEVAPLQPGVHDRFGGGVRRHRLGGRPRIDVGWRQRMGGAGVELLLHRRELDRLHDAVQQQGLTIIPLALYLKDRRIKLLIGLARGKKVHDKRASIKEREQKREIQRAVREHQ